MITTPMPPETAEPEGESQCRGTWPNKAAAVWVGLVTLGYVGTIVMERGERIHRIFSAFLPK